MRLYLHMDITANWIYNKSINCGNLINLSPPTPSQLNNEQSETTKNTYSSFQQKMSNSNVKIPTKLAPYNTLIGVKQPHLPIYFRSFIGAP